LSDAAARLRAIVDSNQYLTLGTADAVGRPWVSPVWFAHQEYEHYYWVSSPEARHSRNVGARPQVSIVIFDSRVPVGNAEAVYLVASAAEVDGDDVGPGMEIFSARSQAAGSRAWDETEVAPPARLRLYRAVAEELFVLGSGDQRVPVVLR
jgi:Pyridoxamine 5'-phosphate oxidase